MSARPSYIRQTVFGAMDGLLVPVGVVSAVYGATHNAHAILAAGLGEAFAGALSMGVGEYVSDEAEGERVHPGRGRHPTYWGQAGIMAFAYIVAASVPLWPYVALSLPVAFPVSILSALVALVAIGVYKGHDSGRLLYSVVEVVLAGSLSAAGGVALGVWVPGLLGH